jgi:hypothetical protein
MSKLSEADRRRIVLSGGYTIAFVLIVLVFGATWLVATLLEELGP